MNTLMQSEIFFFISTVGFIVLGILVAVLLVYLIRTAETVSRITKVLERDINSISEDTKDLIDDMKESTIGRLFFAPTRKRTKVASSSK